MTKVYTIDMSEFRVHISDKNEHEQPEPWVKTYAGGKPNYTTPVNTSDIDQHDPSYRQGFNDGLQYERGVLLELAKLEGITPKDIARVIIERGVE